MVDAADRSVPATAASHGERILCSADARQANTCDCLADLFPPMGIGCNARVTFERGIDLAEPRRAAKFTDRFRYDIAPRWHGGSAGDGDVDLLPKTPFAGRGQRRASLRARDRSHAQPEASMARTHPLRWTDRRRRGSSAFCSRDVPRRRAARVCAVGARPCAFAAVCLSSHAVFI